MKFCCRPSPSCENGLVLTNFLLMVIIVTGIVISVMVVMTRVKLSYVVGKLLRLTFLMMVNIVRVILVWMKSFFQQPSKASFLLMAYYSDSGLDAGDSVDSVDDSDLSEDEII